MMKCWRELKFFNVWFMIALLCAFVPFISLGYAEPVAKTVRVGWFTHPGGQEMHDGVPYGYNYELLKEIAKETGWKYEFVQKDLRTCLEMLKNGELDLMGCLFYSEQRAQIFDYPKVEAGYAYTTLYTKQTSNLTPYFFDSFNGITIGTVENSVNDSYLADFAKDNGFNYKLQHFTNVRELRQAVVHGMVDAGVQGNFIVEDDTRVLAEFAPLPYYFVTTKGNDEVLVSLNRALNIIKIKRPYLEGELYKKYFVLPRSFELTDIEKIQVRASELQPITVGVINVGQPSCYYDTNSKSYKGLIINMMEAVSAKTGLKFVYEELDISKKPPVAWLKEGKVKLVAGIFRTQKFMDDRELVVSDTILRDSFVLVGPKDKDVIVDHADKTISVIRGFQVAQEFIGEAFPHFKTYLCPGIDDCMQAVLDGKADVSLSAKSFINYTLQNPHFEDLQVNTVFNKEVENCVAGRAVDAAMLITIIDKGLAKISDSDRSEMLMNYSLQNPYDMTLMDFIYKHRIEFLIVLVLLGITGVLLTKFFLLKRKTAREIGEAYEQEKAALEIAEIASRAKGNFLSKMSHEIRTPLNAMLGYNAIAKQELQKAQTDKELKEAMEAVADCLNKSGLAAHNLLTIVNDVLDIASIESGKLHLEESGKLHLEHERFDFKSLISSLTTLFYSQAKAAGVHFTVVFTSPIDEWLIGDQAHLNQILTNLLSNAVKFTPKGGYVKLIVEEKPLPSGKVEISFSVQDTGVGMDKDYLERIWTPFEQEDSSISRRFGGTGLGLSIAKSLIDLQNGTISVESERGVGSLFCVNLMFDRIAEVTVLADYDFSLVNALVIDADLASAGYAQHLFARSQAACDTVTSGENALTLLKEAFEEGRCYTLCLFDWQLADMSGKEFVAKVRQIAGDNMPELVVTTYDLAAVANAAKAAGAEHILTKPLFQSMLFDLLADVSGKHVEATKHHDPTDDLDFAGVRILLAEDNAMNMEIAKKLLTERGFIVYGVINGEEAVAVFSSSPPGTFKAVLMDIQMPVLDGHEATRLIRATNHPDAQNIPIIAMTADAFAKNVEEAMACGMNDHIAKPIDLNKLYTTLAKYIK